MLQDNRPRDLFGIIVNDESELGEFPRNGLGPIGEKLASIDLSIRGLFTQEFMGSHRFDLITCVGPKILLPGQVKSASRPDNTRSLYYHFGGVPPGGADYSDHCYYMAYVALDRRMVLYTTNCMYTQWVLASEFTSEKCDLSFKQCFSDYI